MVQKFVDKNQGNGCPPNGVPTLFPMGGASLFWNWNSLDAPLCLVHFNSHCDLNFNINMATARNFYSQT